MKSGSAFDDTAYQVVAPTRTCLVCRCVWVVIAVAAARLRPAPSTSGGSVCMGILSVSSAVFASQRHTMDWLHTGYLYV